VYKHDLLDSEYRLDVRLRKVVTLEQERLSQALLVDRRPPQLSPIPPNSLPNLYFHM